MSEPVKIDLYTAHELEACDVFLHCEKLDRIRSTTSACLWNALKNVILLM